MITTTEVLQASGIKSAKTLMRWYKAGILPKPTVGTHPSGRGKIGFWPDWVAEYCAEIQARRAQGHTLSHSVLASEVESWRRLTETTLVGPDVAKKSRSTGRMGHEVPRHQIQISAILDAASRIMGHRDLPEELLLVVNDDLVDEAIELAADGFNPILVFDGEGTQVTTDFMVAHALSSDLAGPRSYIVIPLFSIIKRTIGHFDKRLPDQPSASPASKVLDRIDDVISEYDIRHGGPRGFELIDTSATIVGMARRQDHKTVRR